MSLNPRFLWKIVALLSAGCVIAAAPRECAKKYECMSSETCAKVHGGMSNLKSILIFKCKGNLVCCPPIDRDTVVGRRTQRLNELRKRRMQSRKLFYANCGKKVTERVYGKGNKIRAGSLPWMALLSYMGHKQDKPFFHCGGTLITDRYVLTAAHCVVSKNNIMIRLGEFDTKTDPDCTPTEPAYVSEENDEYSSEDCDVPPAIDFSAEEIVVHKDYRSAGPKNLINDIALLRMNRSVGRFSKFIFPICLPWGKSDPMDEMPESKMFSIAGWGIDTFGNRSNVLKKGTVQLINLDICKDILYNAPLVNENQKCTAPGDANACMGDSGGPLSIFDNNTSSTVQLGIVSFSNEGACNMDLRNVVVYTKVFAYRNWILDTIQPDDPLDLTS